MRNATMSGYGLATVVVEAGEKSGARAQARMAVEHGRQVVLTEMAVEINDWAKALVGRPGIHVADSLASLLQIIDGLIDARPVFGDELRRFIIGVSRLDRAAATWLPACTVAGLDHASR